MEDCTGDYAYEALENLLTRSLVHSLELEVLVTYTKLIQEGYNIRDAAAMALHEWDV